MRTKQFIIYICNEFTTFFSHRLFKNVSIYAITNVIVRVIPFLLLPILTRYLTPSDYGIVATFQVILGITIVFVGLNAHGAVAVNFFKLNKEELGVYIGNVIYILSASFICTFSIMIVMKWSLSHLLKFPESWLPIIAFVALSQSIFTLTLILWQVEQRSLPYGIFQIVQTITNIILSLYFVVALDWRWQGRLLGIIITSIIFGFISIFIIGKRGYVDLSFNKTYIKDILFFGIPLIAHSLGTWIITSIDRIFINSMVSVTETGMYAVGYQIGMIIGLLATSFNQGWVPFLYEKLREDDYDTKIKIVKFTYVYDAVIIILALFLAFISPYFLSFFVGEDFYSAYKYVLWIALGYAANGMYFMVVNYIFYVKKTYILTWITLFSAVANVILNFFLIKANGPIGAAQATAICFFLSFVLTWISSAKVYEMPWSIYRWKTRE
jgi:O-antigen/teichoic acid export membrane protein